MELFEYYNLDECIDRKGVLSKLKSFKNDGKIEYDLNGDILKIEDIDLDENEIDELVNLFDKNDVFEDLEHGGEDDNWDDDGWSDDSFDDEY